MVPGADPRQFGVPPHQQPISGPGGMDAHPQGAATGGLAQGLTAQRYAYIRLQQAVKAGLIPAHVLAHANPEQYAALWRMVSQHVTDPAAQAGYADPGQWLRQGGQTRPMGPPGIGEQGMPAPAPAMGPPGIGDQTGASVQAQQNVPPNQAVPNPVMTGAPAAPPHAPWQMFANEHLQPGPGQRFLGGAVQRGY